MKLPALSPAVQVLQELALDERVESVWLIGSRANGTASKSSDWDLLVFQTHDPAPTQAKHPDVDVLRVGPSGKVLLDGQSEEHTLLFADFQWEGSGEVARYRGKHFVAFTEGQAVDVDAPRFLRPWQCAKRLWPAGSDSIADHDEHNPRTSNGVGVEFMRLSGSKPPS